MLLGFAASPVPALVPPAGALVAVTVPDCVRTGWEGVVCPAVWPRFCAGGAGGLSKCAQTQVTAGTSITQIIMRTWSDSSFTAPAPSRHRLRGAQRMWPERIRRERREPAAEAQPRYLDPVRDRTRPL